MSYRNIFIMRYFIYVFTFVFLASSTSVRAWNADNGELMTLELGKQFSIQSRFLQESRKILVHLPEGYEQSKRDYPVIYLLDGDSHFNHTVLASTILQQQNMIPASIVVALPNNQGTRTRDLVNESENFQQFISQEVTDFINSQYRTSDITTIFGHSLAGAFVLNAFVSDAMHFDNYIAASPVLQRNDAELVGKFEHLAKLRKTFTQSLYFTLTDSHQEGQEATDALNKLVTVLKSEAPQSLHWHYEFIPDQIHMTTPYLTIFEGLAKVFSDYQAPRFLTYNDFTEYGGLKAAQQFFLLRGEKYGESAEIPERYIRRLGFDFIDTNPKEAIELFQLNVKKHPESPGALFGLARGYENSDQKQKAMKSYQEALTLAESQSATSVAFLKRQVDRYKKILAGK